MILSARTLCLAASLTFALVHATPSFLVGQTTNLEGGTPGVRNSDAAIPCHLLPVTRTDLADDGVQPEWRYTRFGWQDANDWTSLNEIVSPPRRGVDQFHPLVLATLILFSVLAAVVWASNEWEVAQLLDDGTLLKNSNSG